MKEKVYRTDVLFDLIEKENAWEHDIQLRRNEFLKQAGTVDTNLYYVASGSVKISVFCDDEEQIIRLGYKSNFIAALDSFITGGPSDLCLQAIKKCQLKVVSKKSFESSIKANETHRALWQTILEGFVLQQMERERDILTASPLVRYQRVLARSPQLFQEIPHKLIASYLRMSPETLSRVKNC